MNKQEKKIIDGQVVSWSVEWSFHLVCLLRWQIGFDQIEWIWRRRELDEVVVRLRRARGKLKLICVELYENVGDYVETKDDASEQENEIVHAIDHGLFSSVSEVLLSKNA